MPLTKKAKAKAKAIAKARGRASCTHDSPNDEYEFQPPMNDSELQDQAKAKYLLPMYLQVMKLRPRPMLKPELLLPMTLQMMNTHLRS